MRRVIAFLLLSGASVWLGVWLVRRAPRPESSEPTARLETVPATAPGAPQPGRDGGPPSRDATGPRNEQRGSPLSVALCRDGMVLVGGAYCPAVDRECGPIDATDRGCPTHCKVEPQVLRYCVDRYEYPNLEGVKPAAMVSFEEAEHACQLEGKRLCTDLEWTFACEGPLAGQSGLQAVEFAKDCQVGKELGPFHVSELWRPDRVAEVFARVDHRLPSGAQGRCISPSGVRDLVGNLGEWVATTATLRPGRGVMGGDFSSRGAGCRSLQMVSTPHFRAFSTGFRCCADPLVDLPGPGTEATGGRLP